MKTQEELLGEIRELTHRVKRLEYNCSILLAVIEDAHIKNPDKFINFSGAPRHQVQIGSILDISASAEFYPSNVSL